MLNFHRSLSQQKKLFVVSFCAQCWNWCGCMLYIFTFLFKLQNIKHDLRTTKEREKEKSFSSNMKVFISNKRTTAHMLHPKTFGPLYFGSILLCCTTVLHYRNGISQMMCSVYSYIFQTQNIRNFICQQSDKDKISYQCLVNSKWAPISI